jgi:hypothetical protein
MYFELLNSLVLNRLSNRYKTTQHMCFFVTSYWILQFTNFAINCLLCVVNYNFILNGPKILIF